MYYKGSFLVFKINKLHASNYLIQGIMGNQHFAVYVKGIITTNLQSHLFWPWGHRAFFMLNSLEILNLHKDQNADQTKLFSVKL